MSNINEYEEINNIDEVLEALRKVQNYCNSVKCGNCKLRTRDGRCGVCKNTPDEWNLQARTYYV